MSKTKGQEKMREAVRVSRVQVASVDGDWKETQTRWFDMMHMVRRACNVFYETWLVWHVQNQSRQKLEQWLNDRKSLGIKEAGKSPVACVPKGLGNVIYKAMIAECPNLHNRVLGLLQNKLADSLKKLTTSGGGALPGWTSTLLHKQGMPNFVKKWYPIPFDCRCGKLRVENGKQLVELSMWRVPRDGKAATSICDRITLNTRGPGCGRVRQEFENIVSGYWQYKGSMLTYDDRKKKWTVSLCYQCPQKLAEVDQKRTAYLIPGRSIPFCLFEDTDGDEALHGKGTIAAIDELTERRWADKTAISLEGDGKRILEYRERTWEQRSERNSAYRFVAKRKGHGRSGAFKSLAKSSRKWRNFVHKVNHTVSRRAVEWCIANRIGTLIYYQPGKECSATRFVSGEFKNSTWEFFQLGTHLKYKCQDRGVTLKIVEFGKDESQTDPLQETS